MSKKRDLTRVTVNLGTDLVEQLDTYASDIGLTRTSACAVLLKMALNNQKAMTDLGEFLKLAKSQGIDTDELKGQMSIKDFED